MVLNKSYINPIVNCRFRRTFITIIILLLFKSGFGQIFQTNENANGYACYLKINLDSSILFVIQDKYYYLYEESIGMLKHLHDSTYLVSSNIIFACGIMETFDADRFSEFGVSVDSAYSSYNDISLLTIKYYDGKETSLKIERGKYNKFYFDKTKFNRHHPYVRVFTKRINPFNKEKVYIKLPLNSSIDFAVLPTENFKIVINKNILKTIEEPPSQCGPFILKKIGN